MDIAALDAAAYLQPISDEEPCGEALDYDLDFLEFELAAQGKPGQQLGDSIVNEEAPDWPTVLQLATGLARRTKDLRIGVATTRAALATEGFDGLQAGLCVLAGYVEDDWAGVHPRPDEDDDGDPTVRLNALANLCDPQGLMAELRRAPLVATRRSETFSLLDWQEAQRALLEPSADGGPDVATIENAFREADPAELEATSDGISASLLAVQRLDAALRQHVDPERAVSFGSLRDLLEQASKLIETHRPVSIIAETAATPATPVAPATGEIRDRDDIIGMLDRICRWYRANEPASPVPLLLERAKRLVAKDFLALLLELAPDGAPQFRALAGVPNDQD